MAKIAVLAVGGHGHVNPILAVTEELARRKHDVTLWVTEEFRATVQGAGVKFKPVDSLMMKQDRPKDFDPKTMLAMFSKVLLEEALHVLPQLEAGFEEDRPDLLMFDSMFLAGRVLAESRSIPAVTLCTTYAGNGQFSLLEGLGAMNVEALAEHDLLINKIVSQYGVRSFSFADSFQHAEPLNLVFMPKAWQPKGEFFDERYHFIGPCLGTRVSGGEVAMEVLKHHPLLYISLGTAWNEKPEFYKACFQAFGDSEWNVVMSVGSKTDIATLGEAPNNFTVRAHLPQIEVLKHAHVFLTHAGMNSTMEGLSFGVPLVALPQMFEQAVTARRIAELGVGVSLEEVAITADVLRSKIDHTAYDPEIRTQAIRLQAAIAATGGPKLAGDLVDHHLNKLGQKNLRSKSEDAHPMLEASL